MTVGSEIVTFSNLFGLSPIHTSTSASKEPKKSAISAPVKTRYSSMPWWIWGISITPSLVDTENPMYIFAPGISAVPPNPARGEAYPSQL